MMKILSRQAYEDLVQNTIVLARDAHGDKVLQHNNGLVIKLFRRKRLISSAAVQPYAVRFHSNSEALRKRGFTTIDVKDVFRCPAIQRDIVTYQYMEGRMLREAMKHAHPPLLQHFAAFIALLHQKGVYFRSLHLGNVLLQKDGSFALIDVADMSLRPWSLGLGKRLRNFAHMLRYSEDMKILLQSNFSTFLQQYLANSGMGILRRRLFTLLLLRRHPLLAGDL